MLGEANNHFSFALLPEYEKSQITSIEKYIFGKLDKVLIMPKKNAFRMHGRASKFSVFFLEGAYLHTHQQVQIFPTENINHA